MCLKAMNKCLRAGLALYNPHIFCQPNVLPAIKKAYYCVHRLACSSAYQLHKDAIRCYQDAVSRTIGQIHHVWLVVYHVTNCGACSDAPPKPRYLRSVVQGHRGSTEVSRCY